MDKIGVYTPNYDNHSSTSHSISRPCTALSLFSHPQVGKSCYPAIRRGAKADRSSRNPVFLAGGYQGPWNRNNHPISQGIGHGSDDLDPKSPTA